MVLSYHGSPAAGVYDSNDYIASLSLWGRLRTTACHGEGEQEGSQRLQRRHTECYKIPETCTSISAMHWHLCPPQAT